LFQKVTVNLPLRTFVCDCEYVIISKMYRH